MKRFFLLAMALSVVLLAGCGPRLKETVLRDGTRVLQGGRTGVFGTDNSWVRVDPPPAPPLSAPEPVEPQVVRLEGFYSRSSTSWTGCPDATPNRRAKNVRREEVRENWREEVVVYPAFPPAPEPAPAPQSWAAGWGNPSTGNMAVPVAAGAVGFVGGMAVRRPDQTSITQSGGGASATGGSARSTSRARAEATARQWQDQGQRQDTQVSIDD